jgi:hypothetical protein
MEAEMRIIATTALAVLVHWAIGCAWADEPAPEPSVTQRQFSQITATSLPPPAGTPTTALPIHDLSAADAKALKAAGGRKVIAGELWKSETPEEREAQLNNFKQTAAPGTVILIEVPNGNVWAFQPGQENANINAAIRSNILHPWYPYQVMALPLSVAAWDRPDLGRNQGLLAGVSFKF